MHRRRCADFRPVLGIIVALACVTCVLSAPTMPEPRFASYEYDFGAEHGFGASAKVSKPMVSPEIVENLKEEADAGSRGGWTGVVAVLPQELAQ